MPHNKSRARPDIPEREILHAAAVYDGQDCLGYVLARGQQFEAYDSGTQSIGLFATFQAAADAVSAAAGGAS